MYHGTDTERFSPAHRSRWREPIRAELGLGQAETMFLFVGHDYRRKGLATAVAAVERLAAAGAAVRLVVVGGGANRPTPIVAGGSRPTVIFAGPVDDPVPYYSAADALLLPTLLRPLRAERFRGRRLRLAQRDHARGRRRRTAERGPGRFHHGRSGRRRRTSDHLGEAR